MKRMQSGLYLDRITYQNADELSQKYGQSYLIVRSIREDAKPLLLRDNIRQEIRLSPSTGLFRMFLDAEKKGFFDEDWWENIYVPKFRQELLRDEQQRLLKEMLRTAKGKSIALCCFCEDEAMCHRSIVMGALQKIADSTGSRDLHCETDYRYYFR